HDLVDESKLEMILQVVADARLVAHDRDAEALELVGAADAGKLENLDRADRAGRKDHLAAGARRSSDTVLPPAHARRPRAVERDLFHQAMGFEPQIGAVEHRLEKAARRRPAPPALLVDVEDATALVVAGVEVGNALDAGLFRRDAERIEDVPAHTRRLDAQF